MTPTLAAPPSHPPAARSPLASGSARRRLRSVLAAILVGGVVATAHWPVLDATGLALDDQLFVGRNPLVTHPSWSSVSRFFGEVLSPSTVRAYYTPLSMTSLMIDYARGGRPSDPRVFHCTSLALHVLNTVAILLILQRLIGGLPAVFGALVFGLHPLTVEAVASIGERKTLLAAFFAFLSVLFYLRRAQGGHRGWFLASLGAFVLATISKPSVTTLPLVLLLLDSWPSRRLSWSAVVEKWPFALVAIGSAAITVVSVSRTWEFGTPAPASPARTALQIGYLLGFYLGKILWPRDLSTVYAAPKVYVLSDPAVLIGVLATLGLTALLLLAARRGAGGWLTAWLIVVVALVPTFGILSWSSVIAYDRYLYLPMLGVVLMAGLGFARAWNEPRLHGAFARSALVGLSLVVCAGEATATRSTLAHWRDSITLWRHIVRLAPTTPDSHNGLGAVYVSLGARDQAIDEFRRAIQLEPNYGDAHLNLGIALSDLGRQEEAIQHLRRACENQPRSPEAACQLALALKRAGRLDESAAQLERALLVRPDDLDALDELGVVQILRGRKEEGIALLRSALRVAPDDARSHFALAMALLRVSGRDGEALDQLHQAIRDEPEWPAPYNELAWFLATHPDPARRDPAEAVRLADRAAELTLRRDAAVLDTQAAAQAAAGRFEDAARTARSALALASVPASRPLASDIRERLSLYERREPYIAPAALDSTTRGR